MLAEIVSSMPFSLWTWVSKGKRMSQVQGCGDNHTHQSDPFIHCQSAAEARSPRAESVKSDKPDDHMGRKSWQSKVARQKMMNWKPLWLVGTLKEELFKLSRPEESMGRDLFKGILVNIQQQLLGRKKATILKCLPILMVFIFPPWLISSYQHDITKWNWEETCTLGSCKLEGAHSSTLMDTSL